MAAEDDTSPLGQDYFPFGAAKSLLPSEDKSRFVVTKDLGDEFVFRRAPLRNVALCPLLPFWSGLES
ncbi:hypothetical protein [Bradyrhizobium zhanjiangense]|uniref:Uncharacterized protein n=1 Tax=Bradyrhizobium zhanjiangense TaxID=1325107 RepID=A0A4Q0SVB0_9BRAD|nr:hypothetical protein XH94_03980 [Bradyrhizobium zhanjiangense]